MKTLTLSQVAAHIAALLREHGDVPTVLWDMDTGGYYSMTAKNFDAQRMEDGSVRISVGANDYSDPRDPDPAGRPL